MYSIQVLIHFPGLEAFTHGVLTMLLTQCHYSPAFDHISSLVNISIISVYFNMKSATVEYISSEKNNLKLVI